MGLVIAVAGLYAIVVGRLKWDKDHMLEGTSARLVGIVAVLGGAACAAVGVFFPQPIWEAL